MTTIDEQLQILIQDAPADGVTPKVMTDAIAPILKLFAERLDHPEYFVLQTLDYGWVVTTLSNREQPEQQKKVVSAFPTLQDAKNAQGSADLQIMAMSIPVTHILFQLFALREVDSAIFMESPNNPSALKEVKREDLQKLVQIQLQNLGLVPKTNIPPDIA